MARTLNPSSSPFVPFHSNNLRAKEDGSRSPALGVTRQSSATQHEQNRSSSASFHSMSPSDYLSTRSSPSPPQNDDSSVSSSQQGSSDRRSVVGTPSEGLRPSPSFRQVDTGRKYPGVETRGPRDSSMLGTYDPSGDGPETPLPPSDNQATSFFSYMQQKKEPHTTSPVLFRNPVGSSNTSAGIAPSSPSSSLDSSISQYNGANEHPPPISFETQLRSSPLIRDLIERISRSEYWTREIQKDLGEVHRKVNLLVERSLNGNGGGQPEFKDPFAPSNSNNNSGFPNSGLGGPRGSISNLAPHQSAAPDDVSSISQQINTLTSSVGQLLAIQAQQMQVNSSAIITNNNNNRPLNNAGLPMELAPHQIASPGLVASPGMVGTSGMLGHGISNRVDVRPSPRMPNPPMRTWSAGALDLPMRHPDVNGANRQDALLKDKRRSVSGLLRRDSASVLDSPAEPLGGNNGRDASPIITKWEQLPLAPELLRSLTKFGVGPPNKIQQRALPFLLKGSDIIAQAPPTQERIAAYVIPAIQVAVDNISLHPPNRGPLVIMISTTVDQATQAQRMIRDLGGPVGVRSALGVGAFSNGDDLNNELRMLSQRMPHIICGTPQKLHSLFTSPGGLSASEVRFLVLDEVDQLIARNLHDFVFGIVKLLPAPRSRPPGPGTPGIGALGQSPFSMDNGSTSSLGSTLQNHNQNRRLSGIGPSLLDGSLNNGSSQSVERQTALFSNTVPQDVLNLASTIQLREPVRVLVRRDGNVTQADTNQGSRGLRQFYMYLAFTAGGGRADSIATPGGGLGIIGSGRGATSSAESSQAREWKLDSLADMLDDLDIPQVIVHVGGMTSLDAVVYKLASRGMESIPLHGDMSTGNKLAALNKFRNTNSVMMRPAATKVLVLYDVQVKPPEVPHISLIVNYDLPKAVEEYSQRVAPAVASGYARAGVVVNFVTATGGDVEMLRSIECFYKIKCPEVPMSLRDVV